MTRSALGIQSGSVGPLNRCAFARQSTTNFRASSLPSGGRVRVSLLQRLVEQLVVSMTASISQSASEKMYRPRDPWKTRSSTCPQFRSGFASTGTPRASASMRYARLRAIYDAIFFGADGDPCALAASSHAWLLLGLAWPVNLDLWC